MGSIRAVVFAGLKPAIDAHNTTNVSAQIANNTMLRNTAIKSFRAPRSIAPSERIGDPLKSKGVHRFADTATCCGGPVTFDCHVSVVEAPDPGDCPGFTSAVVFPTGCDCDAPYRYFPCDRTKFPLIVPQPVRAPMAFRTVAGVLETADPNLYRGPDERIYVYTWVDRFAAESPPSPPSNVLFAYDDETWTVSGFDAPPHNAVCLRLYRTTSHFEDKAQNPEIQFNSSFQLVEEIMLTLDSAGVPLSPTSYIDTRAAYDMEYGTLLTVDNCPPPCMEQVVLTESGYAVGFSGNRLYMSERHEMHNWPEKFRVDIPDRIVGICVFYDVVFVATVGRPYRVAVAVEASEAGTDASITPQPYTENFPCVSKHTLVATNFGAIYASHKGLVALAPAGPAKLITRDRIDEDEWVQWVPNIAAWHNGKYFASRSPLGQGFIIDFADETEGPLDLGDLVTIDWNPDAVCAGRDGKLYFTEDNILYIWNEGYASMPYTWRSKQWRASGVEQMSALKVVGDYGPPVTVTIYGDSRVYDTVVVKDNTPVRLRRAGRANEWSFKIEGTTVVREVHIASSIIELTLGGQ